MNSAAAAAAATMRGRSSARPRRGPADGLGEHLLEAPAQVAVVRRERLAVAEQALAQPVVLVGEVGLLDVVGDERAHGVERARPRRPVAQRAASASKEASKSQKTTSSFVRK
jgi:hypothetical protein